MMRCLRHLFLSHTHTHTHSSSLFSVWRSCGCEFHLKCCIPPLPKVPSGSFYCFDCSEEGTTSSLRKYFEEHDEKRSTYPDQQSFLEWLWQQDFEKEMLKGEDDGEEGDDDEEKGTDEEHDAKGKSSGSKKKGQTASSKTKKRKRSNQPMRLPCSELGQAPAYHVSALNPLPKSKHDHSPPPSAVPENVISPQERWVVDKRCNGEHDEDDQVNATSTNRGKTLLTPMRRLLMGKPVKLFCSFANGYHSGRIVGVRRGTLWSGARNRQDNTDAVVTNGAHSTTEEAEEEDEAKDEYLLRFQAGVDGRKTTLNWWVCLEEHSLAVATTLIWGDFDNKNQGFKAFKPGRLWLRTTRELIPLLHVLREEHGHVVFMDAINSSKSNSSTRKSGACVKKIAELALTQYIGEFGEDGFKLLHLPTEATDLFSPLAATLLSSHQPSTKQTSSPHPTTKPSKSSRSSSRGGSKSTGGEVSSPTAATVATISSTTTDASTSSVIRLRQMEYAHACAEWEEQQRVYEWYLRRLENPFIEKALICLDEQRLGPLYLLPAGSGNCKVEEVNTKSKGMIAMTMDLSRYHAELAPSIPRGLDRNYIMKLLERSSDVPGSKDVASSLSCETVVSIPAALQSMRDARREQHGTNELKVSK